MKIAVSNHFELVALLVGHFGKRLQIDGTTLLSGSIKGKLDSKEFIINFSSVEYLVICTSVEDREILDEFLPILKRITGLEPLCTYDYVSAGIDSKYAVSTIEWEFQSVEQRKQEIMMGSAFLLGDRVYNIKFYDSKRILIKTAYKYKRNNSNEC